MPYDRPITIANLPAPPSAGLAVCRLAQAAVGAAYRVPHGEIAAASRRSPRAARARQTAIYLAHVGFGLNYCAIGAFFGRDRTTVRHACARIEDARDDAAVDFGLACLEHAARRFLDALTDEARRLAPPNPEGC